MKPKDECGIAAVMALRQGVPDPSRNLAYLVPILLQDMQNRGELSAGITSYHTGRSQLLRTFKALGTVREAFTPDGHTAQEIEACLLGSIAIGHVRYATCGKDDVNYAQPFERPHGKLTKWFSFCFNGNIANQAELKRHMIDKQHYHFNLESDTEVFMHYIAKQISRFGDDEEVDYVRIFAELSKIIDGAWSLALLDARGNLVVARDPLGFKPLTYAMNDDMLAIASESVALWNRGLKNIKSLEPGCILIANQRGIRIQRFSEEKKRAHCYFEWIYFSNVASTIDNRNVYEARVRAGELLAARETMKIDEDTIVVSVPDTAKACGDAMGFALGAKVVEGLFRNRYVGRTFIKSENRSAIVSQKFTPLPYVLKNKKVLLVEDSLVRGTTLKHIIKDMRERGEVAEIHLRIACPPILSPCFYGIDMSTLGELYARKHLPIHITEADMPEEILAQMAAELGADSLRYLSWRDLHKAVDLPQQDLCMACVTSEYPTAQGKHLLEKAREQALSGHSGRMYE